jgi:hypothetical protein
MKTPIKIAVMAFAATLALGTSTYAAEPEPQAGKPRQDNVPAGDSPQPDPQQIMKIRSVRGELVKIDGAFYVIKDASGKEIRLHVDRNTTKLDKDRAKMDRDFKVGDKLEARMNPDGHASSIQMAMATPPVVGKGPSSDDLARANLEEKRRFEAKGKEDPGIYPPDFKPEIGGQQKGAPGDFPKPAFPLIQGELMLIEGEFYTLQDLEGKLVRLHVNKTTKMECGPDAKKGACNFAIGDKLEARRVSPTDPHASVLRKLSAAEIAAMSKVVSPVGASASSRVKDQQVSLGGAKQAVRGEVLKVQGDQYLIKDHHGNEVLFVVNQNTRISCGTETGAFSGLLPDPSASDKPGAKGPQDLSGTNEQKGSQVGPGTKSSAGTGETCAFKAGDKIEAEISDMGAATFIKMAGRAQPGQPLP